MPQPKAKPLTVAVTGPTGDIGRAYLRALDQRKEVGRVLGMARRPFDPSGMGLKKTEYRQGDVLDREKVDELVAEADVVVHLAFIILGGGEETRRVNLEGSRNVFAAAVASKAAKRLVYTSSVAAYGFHEDNPQPLTEDVPTRGTDQHYYSAQKAELEDTLRDEVAGSDIETYVFRPCIVAGRDAPSLIEEIPYIKIGDKLPGAARRLLDIMPVLKPVIPDPGTPLQLVHTEDVADALVAATIGKGEPGIYNLAAEDTIRMTDLASALGWYSIPIPELAVDLTAEVVARMPLMPAQASWINAVTVPVVMDTSRARDKLGWKPKYSTRDTLADTVEAAREEGLL
jgi:UDP-glucose 4-epimerase